MIHMNEGSLAPEFINYSNIAMLNWLMAVWHLNLQIIQILQCLIDWRQFGTWICK
jgi:hypothetical protein